MNPAQAVESGPLAAPRVSVVTGIPSPYQVELFNAVAARGALELRVIYARRHGRGRQWEEQDLLHDCCFLEDSREDARRWIANAQLAVISGYRIPGVQDLIGLRADHGKPWVFWGERPGFRLPGSFGRFLRRWPMRRIRSSTAPLWGIGAWAVEGYRQELGVPRRLYLNVPYYSDLARFSASARQSRTRTATRFLFCGQLIRRKGVDLLLQAFIRLAAEDLSVELHLLGDGPLRGSLQQAAAALENRVIFHGHQPWRSLPGHYARADFLCVPSRHDGWALVVPEGLAAGLPVIASDRTGAALQLLDGDNGWLIPAADGAALYAAMREAAACPPARYRSLSARARNTAADFDLVAGVECFQRAVARSLEDWRQREC